MWQPAVFDWAAIQSPVTRDEVMTSGRQRIPLSVRVVWFRDRRLPGISPEVVLIDISRTVMRSVGDISDINVI